MGCFAAEHGTPVVEVTLETHYESEMLRLKTQGFDKRRQRMVDDKLWFGRLGGSGIDVELVQEDDARGTGPATRTLEDHTMDRIQGRSLSDRDELEKPTSSRTQSIRNMFENPQHSQNRLERDISAVTESSSVSSIKSTSKRYVERRDVDVPVRRSKGEKVLDKKAQRAVRKRMASFQSRVDSERSEREERTKSKRTFDNTPHDEKMFDASSSSEVSVDEVTYPPRSVPNLVAAL